MSGGISAGVICPVTLSVHTKQTHLDCLASLYYNDVTQVLKKCKIYVEEPRDTAVTIAHNRFFVYTQQPGQGYQKCFNGTETSFAINNYQTLDVEDGCVLELPNLRLVASARLPTETVIDHHSWIIHSLPDVLQVMTVDDLDEAIDNLVTNAGGRPTDIKAIRTDLRAYRAEAAALDPDLGDEGILTRLQHQIVSLTIIVSLAIVLFGIIYACVKNWQPILHSANSATTSTSLQQ